jgi:phosphoglycerate dehydrogenase-like enzyme
MHENLYRFRWLCLAVGLLAGPGAWPASGDGIAPEIAAEQLIQELGLRQDDRPVRDRPGWTKPRRIVVRVDSQQRIQWLQQVLGSEVELVPAQSVEQARLAIDGAQALVGYCEPAVIQAGVALHWVQLTKAGVENCLAIPEVKKRGLLLSNLQRIHGPPIAEHVFAMLLAFTRGLYLYVPENSWSGDLVPRSSFQELRGKTLLIAGLGGIGTQAARLGNALGMRVIATRRSNREGPAFVSYVGAPQELLALARQADFVVNAMPLTPETEGLFDHRFFAAMKGSAYFINVGRGKTVVTEELVKALREGLLAGAGLDVTDPEPLPWLHPLWRMDNVIITPHVAAASDLRSERMWTVLRENLRRYVKGEPLLSVVNTELGY